MGGLEVSAGRSTCGQPGRGASAATSLASRRRYSTTGEATAARAPPAAPCPRRPDRAGSPGGAARRPDAGARGSRPPWPGHRARAGSGTEGYGRGSGTGQTRTRAAGMPATQAYPSHEPPAQQRRSRFSHPTTSPSRIIGKPQSSRVISSGRISAHSFRPSSQAIGPTRSLVPVLIAVSVAGRAGRWLFWSRSTGLARAAPVRARKVEGAADQPCHAVGKVIGAAPVNLAEPAPQGAQIGRAAFGDPLHFAGDRVRAVKARAALARRLVREVACPRAGRDPLPGITCCCASLFIDTRRQSFGTRPEQNPWPVDASPPLQPGWCRLRR